jgi:hypothetical protein
VLKEKNKLVKECGVIKQKRVCRKCSIGKKFKEALIP